MRSKKEYSYDTFLSPFTWRYAGDEMKAIWSEENKRLLLRKVWCALAKAENHFGLVSDEELSDIEKHCNVINSQDQSSYFLQIVPTIIPNAMKYTLYLCA